MVSKCALYLHYVLLGIYTAYEVPYNPYLAHCALSKLEFSIGNIYCVIPKERTPQLLKLSS